MYTSLQVWILGNLFLPISVRVSQFKVRVRGSVCVYIIIVCPHVCLSAYIYLCQSIWSVCAICAHITICQSACKYCCVSVRIFIYVSLSVSVRAHIYFFGPYKWLSACPFKHWIFHFLPNHDAGFAQIAGLVTSYTGTGQNRLIFVCFDIWAKVFPVYSFSRSKPVNLPAFLGVYEETTRLG